MAVIIRLRRMGGNKKPFFRVVAADERSSNTGRMLETLGWYDPKQKGTNYKLDLERLEFWRGRGAQISDTVRSLVRKARAAQRRAGAGATGPA